VLRKHGLNNLFELNAGFKGYVGAGAEVETGILETANS
jgi:hypothetical protein